MIQFGHNDQKVQWPQTYAEARDHLPLMAAHLHRRSAPSRRDADPRDFARAPELRRRPATSCRASATIADARTRQSPEEESVALIDLNPMSVRFYEALGPEFRRARSPMKAATRRITTNTARTRSRDMVVEARAPRIRGSSRACRLISQPTAGSFDPSHLLRPYTNRRHEEYSSSLLHVSACVACLLGARMTRGCAPRCRSQVRADAPGAVINPAIYGQFAEHLGRLIYEGIWVGEKSAIPNTQRLSATMSTAALRGTRRAGAALAWRLLRRRISLARWHWPARVRGRARVNTNWGGVVEDNSFGTHEFMDFAELIGADTVRERQRRHGHAAGDGGLARST